MYLPHRFVPLPQLFSFLFFFLLAVWGCSIPTNKTYYLIGRDPSWYSTSFDGQAENINAFLNAVIQEIGVEEGVSIQIVEMNPTELMEKLEDQNINAIFSTLNPNIATLGKFDFSDPFLLLGPVLMTRVDSKIQSLEDLSGKIIGISQFDNSVLVAQKIPSVIIRNYENMAVALEDLVSGSIDGVLMPNLEAKAYITDRYAEILRVISLPLTNDGIRVLALKNTQRPFIVLLNRGLRKLKNKEIYNKLKANFIL